MANERSDSQLQSGGSIGANNGKIAEHKVADRLHNVVDQASDKASELAARASDKASELAGRAGDKASELAARAKDSAGLQVRKVSDLIVARPIGAVCLAFGLGFVLAKLRR